MKKRFSFVLFLSLSCLLIDAYQAMPSAFPNAFIDAVQQNVEEATERIQGCDDISRVIGPISLMSKSASFANVKKLHAQLEALTMSELVGTHIDTLRVAGLYKLAVPLVIEMNTQLLAQLAELEKLHTFWKEAEDYYMPFLLHTKKPRCIVRRLELHQEELYELLGNLVVHVAAVPLTSDAETQYEWFRVLCNYFNKGLPNQKTITTKPIFEAVSALFSKAISSVEKFPGNRQRRLKPYAIPSWLRRNGIGLVSSAAALGGLGSSSMKYKNNIEKAYGSIKSEGKKYYNNVAAALWREDLNSEERLREKDKALKEMYANYLQRDILPHFTQDDGDRNKLIFSQLKETVESWNGSIPSFIQNKEKRYEELSEIDKQIQQDGGRYISDKHDSSSMNLVYYILKGYAPPDKKKPEEVIGEIDEALQNRNKDGKQEEEDNNNSTRLIQTKEKDFCVLIDHIKKNNMLDETPPENLSKECNPLKVLYEGIYQKKMPEKSAFIDSLDKEKLSRINEEEINNAIAHLDYSYLEDVVNPLIVQELTLDWGKAQEALDRGHQDLKATDLNLKRVIQKAIADASYSTLKAPPESPNGEYELEDGIKKVSEKGKEAVSAIADPSVLFIKDWFTQGNLRFAYVRRTSFETLRNNKLFIMTIVSYILFRVGKDMLWPPLHYLFKRSRPSGKYDDLLELLRELKKLFLVNGEKQQAEMDPYDVGLTHYLVHRLEFEKDIPKKYHKKYVQDIRLLQAGDLSAHQKYTIVKDVLQDGYPFLRPANYKA